MFVAADFVLGIVCALLTDFKTLCACWLWKILENLIIISKLGGKLWQREGYMELYLSDRNQLHIFDNDNFFDFSPILLCLVSIIFHLLKYLLRDKCQGDGAFYNCAQRYRVGCCFNYVKVAVNSKQLAILDEISQ